ncbi:MAG: glycosyltransferase family 4 protein [Sphingobacteriaceae bacterium]
MSLNSPSLLVTFDAMKFPHTGLYHFGDSLGRALIQVNRQFEMSFYMSKNQSGFFGDEVTYVNLNKLHKLFFPLNDQFDIVHFTDQYCRLKPQKVHGKKILTIHDLNQIHEPKYNQRTIQRYLEKLELTISACDKIVAISNFVAGNIIEYFPSVSDKVSVIQNGAKKLNVKQGIEPTFIPDKPFLFTIGIVSEKKNFHVLPPLLQNTDALLVISGINNSEYQNKILEEADKYGVRDRVIITGPISETDKAWYYKNCLAFVFPSIAEGFGLPVIEAMHFGKPVFLSRYTSLPEIGGDVAFYFDDFNPDSMIETFKRGMCEYEEKQMKHSIMKHAEIFSWEKTAEQYMNLYLSLL